MKPKLPVEAAELALLARYFQGDLPDTPIGHAVKRLQGKQARDMAKWCEYELALDICDWWRIYCDYQDKEKHEQERMRARKAKERITNRQSMIEGKKAKEEQAQSYREKVVQKAALATPEMRQKAYEFWLKAHK